MTFSIPQKYTRGTYFEVSDTGSVGHGHTIAALRYGGRRPGSHTSPKIAASATSGFLCWAGATKAHITLKMRVNRFQDEYEGQSGYSIRPYLVRATKAYGKASTDNGTFVTLDPNVC